jgi:MFS family permease
MTAAAVILIVVLQPSATVRSERYSHRATLMFAGIVNCVGAIAVAGSTFLINTAPALCAFVAAGVAALTLGEVATNAALNDLVASLAPATLLENYMAVYQASWAVAGLLWPVATLSLLTLGDWPPWVLLAAVGACAGISSFFLQRSRRPGPVPSSVGERA